MVSAPGLNAAHDIPAGLNEILGIPRIMTGAWEPRQYEEGLLWCFLPTETLVSETGWTTRVVQCNLRRGCIEANPRPRSKPRRALGDTLSVQTPGAVTPTPGREGTILEGIAAVTSPHSSSPASIPPSRRGGPSRQGPPHHAPKHPRRGNRSRRHHPLPGQPGTAP